MRRLILFCAAFHLFLTAAFAAPCYGTKMPEKGGFFGGAQTHVILKRYLEDGHGKVRSSQQFLLLSYGITGWLSLDLKGGAGNIKQRPITSGEIDYSSSFAGGYGLRLKVYEAQKSAVVFGFQHISVHPQKTHLGGTKHAAILDDWQFSLLASHGVGGLLPYAGVKWSRLDYIHKVEEDRKRRMSDLTKDIGVVIGCDVPLGQKIWLNLEGQFLDTQAFAVSLNFGF
ncbi:MAG: hypothetical protein PHR11_00570 [Candidatus Omnitrophica bacterium]|nr:hypothetical protein [Candidatus Omnitrophota bacterium]